MLTTDSTSCRDPTSSMDRRLTIGTPAEVVVISTDPLPRTAATTAALSRSAESYRVGSPGEDRAAADVDGFRCVDDDVTAPPPPPHAADRASTAPRMAAVTAPPPGVRRRPPPIPSPPSPDTGARRRPSPDRRAGRPTTPDGNNSRSAARVPPRRRNPTIVTRPAHSAEAGRDVGRRGRGDGHRLPPPGIGDGLGDA